MNSYFVFCIINSLIISSITQYLSMLNKDEDVVKIQLYYECRCPSCIRFDSSDFIPTIKKLGVSRLDLNVYPYGNAITRVNPNGTSVIDCQHGPEECYGNTLHVCSIKYLSNLTEAIFFNGCMMDRNRWENGGSDDKAADGCAIDMNIDPASIKQCAKGQEGFDLLKFYGEETKKITMDGVPYVIVNGVPYDGDNFLDYVCKSFKHRPKECDN